MTLNPAQLEAVTTLSGPLLVLAGAGTGKTRVVTYRIARLIQRGTAPERILGVTFTNKAADEMQERVRKLLASRRSARPEISTFHSLCVRILRRHIHHLGYPRQFAICDRYDQEGVARAVLREIKIHEAALRPSELLALISRWKTHGISPAQASERAETDKEHLAAAAYRRYQKSLQATGSVDFDDLLLLTEALFGRFPAIRRQEAGRFDHLLVDEYQDTNASQYRIVKALAAGHRNLCVVGDDDQSIYGWRGAEVSHILDFTKDWPDAQVVRLQTNYRSTREILAWANRLIAFNRRRHPKLLRATHRGPAPRILQLQDEEEEARTVAEEIRQALANRSRQPRDFAVLFRTNEQPRPLETELRRLGIPYVLVGGQSFYDRKEVRDLLAYLKLAVNPRDDAALLRVINTPPRGIGQATARRLTSEAVSRGCSIWDLLPHAAEWNLPASAIRGTRQLRTLIQPLHDHGRTGPLVELVSRLIDHVGFRQELARLYPNPEDFRARWGAVEEIVNAASSYQRRTGRPTLGGFVQEFVLASADDDRDRQSKLRRNAVALLTLHAAKGLEFPVVYIAGLEEGLLPHKKSVAAAGGAVDEERRLCYVGITRAQKRLTLTMSLARRKRGKLRPTTPSRFLYELTGQADNPNYLAAANQKKPAPAGSRLGSRRPRSGRSRPKRAGRGRRPQRPR